MKTVRFYRYTEEIDHYEYMGWIKACNKNRVYVANWLRSSTKHFVIYLDDKYTHKNYKTILNKLQNIK